jgi:phosphoglycerol transferase MdoB-like AlkP superfamily enzyme
MGEQYTEGGDGPEPREGWKIQLFMRPDGMVPYGLAHLPVNSALFFILGRKFSKLSSSQFYKFITGFLLLLLLHTSLRVIFWVYNDSQFADLSARDAWLILTRGAQQDLVSLIFLNNPLLILLLISTWIRTNRTAIYRVARWLFVALNTAGLALNYIDTGYYRFSRHRSNIDLFYVFGDSLGSLRSILSAYWPLILCFIGGVVALVAMAKLLVRPSLTQLTLPHPAKRLGTQALILLALLMLTGLVGKERPIIPTTPLLSIAPAQLPLAQNSVLTFFYSVLHRPEELDTKKYFSQAELTTIAPTTRVLVSDSLPFQRKNVVICILESFSRCYVTPGHPYKANTPFFDSLIKKSMYFPRAYANGYASNQGIVSILGGLPPLLEEPFYYSEYANTSLRSIGNILKEQGYNTNFFMGAGKDHFGFGKLAHMAGIDHAYWQNDFNNDVYFDGNWGIFDGPFLQYGAKLLSGEKEPFMATFFNISSHYPYTIPANERARFTQPGMTPQQRSISYVDDAFRQFFAACSKAPWFRNTLFVFSADHWMSPDDKVGYTYVNSNTIPIFIYDPSQVQGSVDSSLISQVDITPIVLDRLHYKGAYTGFGRGLRDTATRYVLNRYINNYQLIDSAYVLGYTPAQGSSYLYRYASDSLFEHNLLGDPACREEQARLEKWMKANLQAYAQALKKRSFE